MNFNDFIQKQLAALLDRFKVGNPTMYLLLMAVLGAVHHFLQSDYFLNEVLDGGKPTWYVTVLSFMALVVMGATGPRTTRFLKNNDIPKNEE